MTQKPKLEPGDRVRCYDGEEVCSGTVVKICSDGTVDVDTGGAADVCNFHPKQCRKLRPKQKPEKERERKTWHVGSFSQTEDGSTTGTLFPSGHVRPPCFGTDLVTIEPGQVVLGREELAKAVIKAANAPSTKAATSIMAEALGLGKDKTCWCKVVGTTPDPTRKEMDRIVSAGSASAASAEFIAASRTSLPLALELLQVATEALRDIASWCPTPEDPDACKIAECKVARMALEKIEAKAKESL